MAEIMSEHEKDLLAQRVYEQAVTPVVHRLITPDLKPAEIQKLFGSFQDIAHGALRAAEEYSAIRFAYRQSQDKLREEMEGDQHVEIQSPIIGVPPIPISRKPKPT